MTKLITSVVDIRLAKYDVYIGRAGDGLSGYFGNPFRLNHESERAAVLTKYRAYFYERMERDKFFKARVHDELRGRVLGCFCAPMPCHGDIIAEYLNGLPL
jgi:hypothetical protein